jgi:transcriptional regulator with XRE-family HTH domain
MPRAVTHRHVLRDLRGTIGKTQSQLAQMIGVQPITVNRIENGSLKKISPHLAVRIQLATGISISELVKGQGGKLIDCFGRPYSNETFARWKKAFKQASEDDAIESAKKLHWWLEVLLRAAARYRGGTGYNGAVATLIQSMEKIRRDFGLGKVVDAILDEYKPRVEWRPGAPTPDDLRKIQEELEMETRNSEPPPRVHWFKPTLQSKQLSKRKRRR